MRNVARSGVMTNFVLHIDADLVPTPSLRNKFREFITKNNLYSRSAARSSTALYVLPVFELRQFQTPVRSKQDLITAINARNARTFLQETCLQCHQPTNYDKWQQESKNATGLSYKVDYVKEWAPFFIAPRFSPMFDERFTSFGHDNLAHVCELQANGYHFYVLNDEFLICNGYRSKNKLTEFERKRRDSRDSFYKGFLQKLRNNGYVGSMYNNCYE
uniref:Beta-1,4-glucuronyltransferase 1 n=1 Tax=Ciona savignyi TaxID=51511 RepID=H2Z1D4_CIOSA